MTTTAELSRPVPDLRRWALPVVLGAVGAAEASLDARISSGSALPAVFAAVMASPLAWREQYPLGALTATLAVYAAHEVEGTGALSEAAVPFVVLVVAMYSAAARLRGRYAAAALALSSATIGGTIVHDSGLDVDSLVYASVVIAAAFAAGRLFGQRTRQVGQLADEKDQLLRERDERERAAAERERLRIAQELHDLITHRVSAMVLQASTERHIVERDGGQTDRESLVASLGSIESLGREAMAELRQLLGALFHGGDEPRSPQPGTADLPALVDACTGTGVDLSFETRGEPRVLPEPVEVSLYRLAQEALSNAMRHAPGSTVSVTLSYDPAAVGLTVVNTPGRAASTRDRGLGLGLAGMRERARQFGGTLDAAPTPDGGFAVRAHLPTGQEATR